MDRRTRVALFCLALAPLSCKKDEEKKADGAAQADAKDAGEKKAEEKKAAPAKKAEAAPAKRGGGSGESVQDALSKVTGSAVFAMHMDLKRMSSSPIWEQMKKQAEQDPEYGKRMAALAKCGINFGSLETLTGPATLTMGFAGEEDGAIVLHIPGIGKKDMIECMLDVAKKDDPEVKASLAQVEGKDALQLEEDGVAFLVPDDYLVAGPKEQAPAIKKVLFDGGANASAGPLPGLLSKVATDKAAWFAGDVTKLPDVPKDGPLVGLQSVAGNIDIDTGLGVTALLTYADATQAKNSEAELNKAWQSARPLVAGMGVTPEMANKLTFKAADTTVTVALSLSAAELNQVGQTIGAMTAAAAGGPPGMPPGGMPPGGMPPGAMPPPAGAKPPAAK